MLELALCPAGRCLRIHDRTLRQVFSFSHLLFFCYEKMLKQITELAFLNCSGVNSTSLPTFSLKI